MSTTTTPAPAAPPRRGWIAVALLVAGLSLCAAFPVRAGDAFWNVACGERLLARGFAEHDDLTHTAGKRRVVHHEWGAQIVWALAYRAGGLGGLRVLRVLLLAATLALLLLLARRVLDGSTVLALLVVGASWWLLRLHVSARPRLVGWALLALCGWLFFAPRAWSGRRALALALVAVAWVNLHSSALLLPLVAGLSFADALVLHLLASGERRRRTRAELGRWGAGAALCAAALLAQPAGARLLAYYAATPALNRRFSTEWWPLWRADAWGEAPEVVLLTAALGVAALLLAASRWRRARASEELATFPGPLLALGLVALALYSRRMTVALPLAALFVAVELRALLARRSTSLPSLRPLVAATLLLAFVLTTVALSLPPEGFHLRAHLARRRFPVAAAQLLARARLRGKLFNPEGWGGYLSLQLYPRLPVFIDGRWLAVGERVFRDHNAVLLRRGDVAATLKRYGVDVVVEPTSMHLRVAPLTPQRWRLAYRDAVAVVLVRRDGPRGRKNLARLCALYRADPRLARAARWPGKLVARDGRATATAVPSAVTDCQ